MHITSRHSRVTLCRIALQHRLFDTQTRILQRCPVIPHQVQPPPDKYEPARRRIRSGRRVMADLSHSAHPLDLVNLPHSLYGVLVDTLVIPLLFPIKDTLGAENVQSGRAIPQQPLHRRLELSPLCRTEYYRYTDRPRRDSSMRRIMGMFVRMMRALVRTAHFSLEQAR